MIGFGFTEDVIITGPSSSPARMRLAIKGGSGRRGVEASPSRPSACDDDPAEQHQAIRFGIYTTFESDAQFGIECQACSLGAIACAGNARGVAHGHGCHAAGYGYALNVGVGPYAHDSLMHSAEFGRIRWSRRRLAFTNFNVGDSHFPELIVAVNCPISDCHPAII